jgi:hypothetical protein
MIAADRRLLEATQKQTKLVIQEKIINHYINSFNMIATQAAVLAGFSFGAFGVHDEWMSSEVVENNEWLAHDRFIFVNACTASTSLNIFAVVVATFCSIEAPKLALMGPEGSAEVCLQKLRVQHEKCIGAHVAGLLFFFLSVMDLGFLSYSTVDGVFMCLQLIVAVCATAWNIHHVYEEFSGYQEDSFTMNDPRMNARFSDNETKVGGAASTRPKLVAGLSRRMSGIRRKSSSEGTKVKQRRHSGLELKQGSLVKNVLGFGSRGHHSTDAADNLPRPTNPTKKASNDMQLDSESNHLRERLQERRREQDRVERQKAKALVKAGIATKQGHRRKNWKPRYFELFRDKLAYYESKGGEEKGRLCLYDKRKYDSSSVDGAEPINLAMAHKKGVDDDKRPYCEVTPTTDLNGGTYKEYTGRKYCLQVRCGEDVLYMDLLNAEQRDDWALQIRKCASAAKKAAESRVAKKKAELAASLTGAATTASAEQEVLADKLKQGIVTQEEYQAIIEGEKISHSVFLEDQNQHDEPTGWKAHSGRTDGGDGYKFGDALLRPAASSIKAAFGASSKGAAAALFDQAKDQERARQRAGAGAGGASRDRSSSAEGGRDQSGNTGDPRKIQKVLGSSAPAAAARKGSVQMHSDLKLRQKTGTSVFRDEGSKNKFNPYKCQLAGHTLTVVSGSTGSTVDLNLLQVNKWDGKGQFTEYKVGVVICPLKTLFINFTFAIV